MTTHFHVGANGRCWRRQEHVRYACRDFYDHTFPPSGGNVCDTAQVTCEDCLSRIGCNAAEVTCEDCLRAIRSQVERALLASQL